MKIRFVAITAILCLLSARAWAQTNSALASDPSGWIDILPRESLAGWTRVAIPPDKALDPVSQWELDKVHRTILCTGDRGHEWLRYDRELANFILHVQWRFEKHEGLKGYNSGVFVRNSRDGRVWLQAQVGAGNAAYLFGETLINGKLASKRNPAPTVNRIKPAGEWNTYEFRCEGPKITLWVNGDVTSELDVPEVPRGYWGLEAEGFRIEFRDMQLKILP